MVLGIDQQLRARTGEDTWLARRVREKRKTEERRQRERWRKGGTSTTCAITSGVTATLSSNFLTLKCECAMAGRSLAQNSARSVVGGSGTREMTCRSRNLHVSGWRRQ
jgi:hypothetical protein